MSGRILGRVVVVAGAALALGASSASAQFNYYTTGYFTSPFGTCNQAPLGTITTPPAANSATCTGGGFTLTFTGAGTPGAGAIPGGFSSGSQVNFGNFNLSGSGNVTVPAGVFFTLLVNQIQPTTGTAVFAGAITGQVTVGIPGTPNFSNLIWSPNQTASAPPVSYSLLFNRPGGIAIPANGNASIDAIGTVSSVPEPASLTLMGTGLLAIGGLVRRQRRSRVS